MSWFRARDYRNWGLGQDRTPHLPVESHCSRTHSGYCCALWAQGTTITWMNKNYSSLKKTTQETIDLTSMVYLQNGRTMVSAVSRPVSNWTFMEDVSVDGFHATEHQQAGCCTSGGTAPYPQNKSTGRPVRSVSAWGVVASRVWRWMDPAHKHWIVLSYVCWPTDTE